MAVELRKLQKSKTGFYVTIPTKITKELELNGDELIKFVSKGDKVYLEVVRIQ